MALKLTRDEINALEAGYETDCLVAEYVMRKPKPGLTHEPDHIGLIDAGSWYCLPDYYDGDRCEWTPHAFSSNISFAWMLVMQFDRYTICSALDNMNYCALGADLVGAYGETPAIAICRASLRVVMNA